MRTLATVLAIAVLGLLFGELSGCGTADTDTPIVVLPRDANGLIVTPTPTPTSAAVVVTPPPATFAPAPTTAPNTYTTKRGTVLSLACPPDPANCGDANSSPFGCQDDAQAYFQALAAATGKRDCAGLDGDGDGFACNGVGLPQHCP